MVKTQIQLEEWQYDALKEQSAIAARSMSDFVREAVSAALERQQRQPRGSLAEISGKYAPLPNSDLKAHDARWAEAIR
jgi:hypothetical protein